MLVRIIFIGCKPLLLGLLLYLVLKFPHFALNLALIVNFDPLYLPEQLYLLISLFLQPACLLNELPLSFLFLLNYLVYLGEYIIQVFAPDLICTP